MIKINEELIEEIRRHGEKTYNEECCGAVLGEFKDNVHVTHQLIEFENEKNENKQQRYLITPEQYRESENRAKKNNLELLGFYHSHPDHPALPSQFDKDYALPWFIYMIVSVKKGKADDDLTAWVLSEDRKEFKQQEISIIQKTKNEMYN
ncbi:MAG TPA: M67 family peptidase [Ignavibacteria bacterium]|nr:M67 family peptidase [Ignavibacteria bacterium]